ncbi:uncharacterized protein LOC119578547 [Penaeus monodon]|uniref:uncharacterized protein LOC119578547 n=1 Tax=Penaeus monodon TaxID=6687 RepID=UPI0018A7D608|nr:uncharacterized protein LOC119578547 [Penaeus monodon]
MLGQEDIVINSIKSFPHKSHETQYLEGELSLTLKTVHCNTPDLLLVKTESENEGVFSPDIHCLLQTVFTPTMEAYKYWVCSQLFPYYDNGRHIKPCRRFCHEVEQKCPYLLPKDKPVAGEPTFLCEDPAIGELENQESSYGKDSCCYKLSTHPTPMCSLNENPAEHQTPVLSSTCPTTSGTHERPSDNQCLSAIGADPSLRQSHSSTAAPSSSGSCSVISRKHCWTRTALSILLLCLVRTRVWLPRGFT